MIDQVREGGSIIQACRLCGVARSSYYAGRKPSAVRVLAPDIEATMRRLHAESRCSFGSRQMSRALRGEGFFPGRYQTRTLMRLFGLILKKPRYQHYRRNTKPAATAANLLNRQFDQVRANAVWAGDITFIPTAKGWLYLAIVVDLFSRRIVGWAFATTADTQLTVQASDIALAARQPSAGLMFHSDQGCQYTSERFVAHLKGHGIVQSMSRKGNCWDNAVVERVFRSLKQEWIGEQRYDNPAQARRDITDYIVRYYNCERPHTALNHLPPAVFEALAA
jgi:putative transposase